MNAHHRPAQLSGSTQAVQTPPPSEGDSAAQNRLSRALSLPPPDPYNDRDLDFFQPGRLFRVWAPNEEWLHEKEFLLIGTRNSHGACLAVHLFTVEELRRKETGSFHRTHALIQDFEAPTPTASRHKRRAFRLSETEEEIRVPERCFIELDHNYDILFSYACEDCGMLYRPDLKKVRKWFVEWLMEEWDLND